MKEPQKNMCTNDRKLFSANRILYLKTVLHGGMLAHHAMLSVWATVHFDTSRLDKKFHVMEKYSAFLLTGWNMAFQMVFLCLALYHDMSEWRGLTHTSWKTRVLHWRDVVFTALVVPFSMFVGSIFWLLYHLDRELVFPEELDAMVPPWFNHGVHSSILFVVVMETVLQKRVEPTSHGANLRICWFFSLLYAVGYYSVYFISGGWIYPVFGTMTFWQICAFQIFLWTLVHVFYVTQWRVVNFLHNPTANGLTAWNRLKIYVKNLDLSSAVRMHASEYFVCDKKESCVVFKCNRCLNECLDCCVCS